MYFSATSRPDRLPARYHETWGAQFWNLVNEALFPGAIVLDIGSGRRPTISPGERPRDTHYVGLDVSAEELAQAPEGSYDEVVAADAERLVPSLRDRFDLIISWQVLEHIRHLDRAAGLFHEYAKPGGWFVACLSGRNAVFAVANRILPSAVGARLVARLRQRPLESVFPTHYDCCTESGLRSAFKSWDELQVIPLWHAADYFDRLPLIQGAYIRYENWTLRRGLTNLCTHYVVAARKG